MNFSVKKRRAPVIIIVSLVRSNRRRDIGFLRLMQRINVALSRAKTAEVNGIYILVYSDADVHHFEIEVGNQTQKKDFTPDNRDELEKILGAKFGQAVKANDPLEGPELENLVNDLRQCAMPYTCPHGRPTLIEMSHRELEKKFGRLA